MSSFDVIRTREWLVLYLLGKASVDILRSEVNPLESLPEIGHLMVNAVQTNQLIS
jgi:hypothetical protein